MSKLMSRMRVSTKMMGNLKAERIPLLPQVHSVCVHVHVHVHIYAHVQHIYIDVNVYVALLSMDSYVLTVICGPSLFQKQLL